MPSNSRFDLVAYLNALGLMEGLDTFKGRLQIQKSVYLLNEFGANLPYRHHWYIHGPYTPALTRELFDQSGGIEKPRKLNTDELQIVNAMRNFLGKDLYSAESLELLVSVLFLIKYGPNSGLDTKQKIISFLRQAKPYFTPGQIDAAWDKIQKNDHWKDDLAKVQR